MNMDFCLLINYKEFLPTVSSSMIIPGDGKHLKLNTGPVALNHVDLFFSAWLETWVSKIHILMYWLSICFLIFEMLHSKTFHALQETMCPIWGCGDGRAFSMSSFPAGDLGLPPVTHHTFTFLLTLSMPKRFSCCTPSILPTFCTIAMIFG